MRRVRQIIAETLDKREIDPPATYVKIQIARLNDAMAVAHVKMIEGDLQAIDRIVKLVGELDRYHGFGRVHAAPAPQATPAAPLQIAAAPAAAEAEIFLPTSA